MSDNVDVVDASDEVHDESSVNLFLDPLEVEIPKSNKNVLATTVTRPTPHTNNKRQLGYFKINNVLTPLFDDRPHACKKCNKTYKNLGSLEQHMRQHEQVSNTDTG